MLEIPLGALKFNDDVLFIFPNQLCCNCGAKSGLQVIEQDTRRTRYLVAGGTEQTFRLPLPFCPDCAPSAKRRPKNIAHRALGFLLSFAVAALVLIVIGDLVLHSAALANYLLPLSLALAAMATLVWIAISRPKGKQTSYFQPVRIPKLKQEFVSGAVTAIGFSFSNTDYARAFISANRRAIEKKVVTVERAK